MTERSPCTTCGVSILSETAERNSGLCMPCKGGYREDIEASRRFNEKQKKLHESPAAKHWLWLVSQVNNEPGFNYLSSANQCYFSVGLLDGEVYNGGFDQYFSNSSADFYDFALKGLAEMGAVESYRLLELAGQLYFGADQVPTLQEKRLQYLGTNLLTEDQSLQIEELDRLFCMYPDMLQERIANYALMRRLFMDSASN